MNEQEFDQRIKENALLQESGIEKPLWNKDGTWDHIEAGLDKNNHATWWKIAAVILLFFSIGMTWANWIESNKLKSDKQLELSELQQQINALSSKCETEKETNLIVLRQKNGEVDSLKKQLNLFKTTGQQKVTETTGQIQFTHLEVMPKQETNQNVIDSLKNTIQQLQATVQDLSVPKEQEKQTLTEHKPKTSTNEITPERRIYYISNEVQMPTKKPKRGLKIEVFGSPDEPEIEYQSNYSIFKKQQP